ncbi:MAG: AMP-binding protein [Candidatus Magnetomorum sp.]|nr:AMP-binding protein [Candidatus Magnetomorum sp.]
MNFWNLCKHHLKRTAFVTENGKKISYSELDVHMNDFSKKLGQPKKLVFLKCTHSYQSVLAFLACLNTNNPLLLLDKTIDKELLDHLISVYQPHFIISDNQFHERNNDRMILHPDLALLLSTSGSTGSPKLVQLSQSNLIANARSITEYLEIKPGDTAITTLPMNYSYGLSVITSHLLAGATVVLNNFSMISREFWHAIQENSVTTFSGVPYIYQTLKRLKYARFDTRSITYLTQAGGRLDEETAAYFVKECSQRNQKFIIMYGQTEATARISYLPPHQFEKKHSSIGIPIPGGKLTLMDKNGITITQPHVEGELVYQGKNVMLGYAQSLSDLANGDVQQGVLKTGDMGYFDEDSFFYLTGRKKRFIKIAGSRISLSAVEDFLSRKGYAVLSGGKDDLLKIAVTGEESLLLKIKTLVSSAFKLNINHIDCFLVDHFPRTSAGKIDYQLLFKNEGVL